MRLCARLRKCPCSSNCVLACVRTRTLVWLLVWLLVVSDELRSQFVRLRHVLVRLPLHVCVVCVCVRECFCLCLYLSLFVLVGECCCIACVASSSIGKQTPFHGANPDRQNGPSDGQLYRPVIEQRLGERPRRQCVEGEGEDPWILRT